MSPSQTQLSPFKWTIFFLNCRESFSNCQNGAWRLYKPKITGWNQRKTNERLEVLVRPAETSASESPNGAIADFVDEGIFVALTLCLLHVFSSTPKERCNIHHPNHQVWNLKFLPTSGLKDPFLAFQKHHPSYHQQATIGMAASLLGPGRFGKQLLTRFKPMGWIVLTWRMGSQVW